MWARQLESRLKCSIAALVQSASARGDWLNGQLSQLVNWAFWTIFLPIDSMKSIDLIEPIQPIEPID
jgi:hypothetical protein